MDIPGKKIFVIDKKNDKFQLFLDNLLTAESYFTIIDPDELFDQKYLGLFRLKTEEDFRGKGFMKYLLTLIFNYAKNKLNVNYILLNVYKSNTPAVNLYFNSGFEIYKNFEEDEIEKPYFTLIKKLN